MSYLNFYRIYLTIVIFVCRGLIAGVFQALFVYTPEVYPTKVRALGLGTGSTFGRIGGIMVPYIAQVCTCGVVYVGGRVGVGVGVGVGVFMLSLVCGGGAYLHMTFILFV